MRENKARWGRYADELMIAVAGTNRWKGYAAEMEAMGVSERELVAMPASELRTYDFSRGSKVPSAHWAPSSAPVWNDFLDAVSPGPINSSAGKVSFGKLCLSHRDCSCVACTLSAKHDAS